MSTLVMFRVYLLKVESVGDVVCCEESGHQVGDGTSFTAVRTKLKGVQSPLPVQGQEVMLCKTTGSGKGSWSC